MTSLPVRKLYQRIGEQIDAQVDAVVHIENSIYLRSKAIDNDSESLKAFLEYSISLLGLPSFLDRNYELQIKQNNTGVNYGIVTFVETEVAQQLIEEHPTHFKDELAFITSAYLQPRRNLTTQLWKSEKKSQKSPIKSPQSSMSPKSRPKVENHQNGEFISNFRDFPRPPNSSPKFSSPRYPQTRNFPTQNLHPHHSPMVSPPKIVVSESNFDANNPIPNFQMPKPCFKDDVAELSRRLDSLKMKQPKIENAKQGQPYMPDLLFDSGTELDKLQINNSKIEIKIYVKRNSSPDDFSFNSDSFRASTSKTQNRSNQNFENEIYPFGSVHLCLPKTNFSRISRCSSFNSEESFANSDKFSRFF